MKMILGAFLVLLLMPVAVAKADEDPCVKTVVGTTYTVRKLADKVVHVDVFRPKIGEGLYRAYVIGQSGALLKGSDFEGRPFPDSPERARHFQSLLDEALEACGIK